MSLRDFNEPAQPIAFSHQLHSGKLQIACLYCHGGAEKSRHAGIPPLNVCMNCHSGVTATLAVLTFIWVLVHYEVLTSLVP